MSDAIFQQDGAPAHNAKITQDWLGGRINKFWVKGTWPANSPDLSPIENLWSILKNNLDSMGGLKDLKMLESQLKPHGPILHLKFGQLNGWDAKSH